MTVADGVYTLDINCALPDGRVISAVYEGPIEFPVPETAPVTFDKVVFDYVGTIYCTPIFSTADGKTSLKMDLSYPSADYCIPVGTYNYNAEEGLCLDEGYATLTVDGTDTDVTSGTVVIAKDGNVYDVTFDLGLADGNGFKGNYKGGMSTFGQEIDMTFNSANFQENDDMSRGEFYLKLTSATWCTLALDFFADPEATSLPAGTYTYSDNNLPGTFGASSYLETYSPYYPDAYARLAEGSTVTVTADGYSGKLIMKDGRTVNFSYTAPVEPTVFSTVETAVASTYTTITFATADESKKLEMDISYPSGTMFLPEGEFTYGGSPLCIDADYATLYVGDETIKVNGGKMNVTRDGNNYSVTFELTLANGKTFEASYSGTMDTFCPIIDIEYSDAGYLEIDDAAPGEHYVRMNNSSWSSSLAFDFFAEAGTDTLPAGTYTYSADNTPGTFGPKSYVDTIRPYAAASSARMAEGSTVTVTATGITGKLIMADGRTINISFTGEIIK